MDLWWRRTGKEKKKKKNGEHVSYVLADDGKSNIVFKFKFEKNIVLLSTMHLFNIISHLP